VQLAAPRRFQLRHGLVAVLSLGVLLMGLTLIHLSDAARDSAFVHWISPGIPGLILVAMCLSTAEAIRLPRFVGHAVAFLAAALVVAALDVDPGWALLAGGAVMASVGALLLARFLREHPELPDDLEP
jgi:peptidoglycan/LPS O-acetylase OafA/YrhL